MGAQPDLYNLFVMRFVAGEREESLGGQFSLHDTALQLVYLGSESFGTVRVASVLSSSALRMAGFPRDLASLRTANMQPKSGWYEAI